MKCKTLQQPMIIQTTSCLLFITFLFNLSCLFRVCVGHSHIIFLTHEMVPVRDSEFFTVKFFGTFCWICGADLCLLNLLLSIALPYVYACTIVLCLVFRLINRVKFIWDLIVTFIHIYQNWSFILIIYITFNLI